MRRSIALALGACLVALALLAFGVTRQGDRTPTTDPSSSATAEQSAAVSPSTSTNPPPSSSSAAPSASAGIPDFPAGDDPSGGHIATIVASPDVPAGFRSSERHDHYTLLRTIHDAWSLDCLAESCSAGTMDEFFSAR